MALQESKLRRRQLRILSLHLQELLWIKISYECHAHNSETIRAHVRNVGGNVNIHAVNNGHHRDKRGGGENDSEQREKTAELAGTKRIERHGARFAKGRSLCH